MTPEYLAENVDAVNRNFAANVRHRPGHRYILYRVERYEKINRFLLGATMILSVGCGGHEPVRIRATHAVDIVPNSETYLRKLGWTGEFKIASCDNIPYPDKFFDVAVCSEVIEHLPLIDNVTDTFKELDRVAKKWIVTTPSVAVKEPTHKRVFTHNQLSELIKTYAAIIIVDGGFFYIEKI